MPLPQLEDWTFDLLYCTLSVRGKNRCEREGGKQGAMRNVRGRMKLFSLSLLALLFVVSCKRNASPSVTAPTPTPAPTPEPAPQIYSSELRVAWTVPLPAISQQDITFTPHGLTIATEKQTATLISETLSVTLDAPAPFLALAAKWSSVISKDAKLTVSVRASANGNDWSAWQLSSLDGDPRTQAGLFFFAAENKFIQYRIEMERDANRQAPLIESLQFRFISPGATPQIELTNLRALQFLRRGSWHCPTSNFKSKSQTAPINHLIVHHTATANEVADWPAVVRTIWNFHAVTNGWRDLGYHYLIDPNGVIYEGRAGGDKAAGIHFSCANTGTLGIAMLGNFTTESPTEQALRSLKVLLAQKTYELKLEPSGSSYHPSTGLNLPQIAGHRDANAAKIGRVCAGTHCPGEALYTLLPAIRTEVQAMLIKQSRLEIPLH